MKGFLSFLIFSCSSLFAFSQSVSPSSIVSAGNAATVGGVYVSWSVGETFVTTLSAGDIILTQGFQQPAEEVDADNDGFTEAEDCDDNNAEINPAAIEICDGLDNNCNADVDEGLLNIYFADLDADGFGDPLTDSVSCEIVIGFVLDNTDCNDADDTVYPGAAELCDGIDQDCDGVADNGLATQTYYADVDGDGFGDPLADSRSEEHTSELQSQR